MKSRCGQVAIYLVMTLVAITFLVLMNVGAYLGVTAKNRAMNAGDAAALAVAKYQGELLNRIGTLNIEHLKAALDNDEARCREIVLEQMRICLLDPLEGIRIGNDAARLNGAKADAGMTELLRQHVIDIRNNYLHNPEAYPQAWDGAWEEYAQQLELSIGEGIIAGPDNIDFVDAATGHFLLNKLFYNAVGGRNWCWFHFNAQGLLDGYSSFRDWAPLPGASDEVRRRRCVNSEVYSLNLDMRTGSIRDMLGEEIIMSLSGASLADIGKSHLITNVTQSWFFYDTSRWRSWWEMDPNGRWNFPVVGKVKPEFDVRGCAAVCRVSRLARNLLDGDDYSAEWSAAAKPFGTVEDERGEISVVTSLRNFVVSSFTDVRLVPIDSVGGKDLSTADHGWMMHLREHLPLYLSSGPSGIPGGCYYCEQLRDWERESLRSDARRWLKLNSGSCIRSTGGGSERGGTPHGH